MRYFLLLLLWPCWVIAQTNVGGLQLLATPELVIHAQTIILSPDQVKISTQFMNNAANDITETLVFGLPEKGDENFTQYNVAVNQQPIQPMVMQRALSVAGRDVSPQLKVLGLTFNPIAAMQNIDTSTNRASIISKLHALHLLDPLEETPNWNVQTYYYWQQTFPAQDTVTIEHSYKPKVSTRSIKLNSWATILKMPVNLVKKMVHMAITWRLEDNFAAENLRTQFEKYNPQITQFCPTTADYEALISAYKKQPNRKPHVEMRIINLDCNADQMWAKAIAHYSLTIQAPQNSYPLLCWNGTMQRTKNTLEFSAENYVPPQNISILFVEQ